MWVGHDECMEKGLGGGEGKKNKRLETNAVFSMNRFETHQTKGIQITTTGRQ